MKIYMICPVRRCTVLQAEQMEEHVRQLEVQGHEVHYPPRDVDQSNDDGGVRICKEHRIAMSTSDEIHVWWDRSSTGSHFDLGMAFFMQLSHPGLEFVLVNEHEVQPVNEKSFQNILIDLVENEAGKE